MLKCNCRCAPPVPGGGEVALEQRADGEQPRRILFAAEPMGLTGVFQATGGLAAPRVTGGPGQRAGATAFEMRQQRQISLAAPARGGLIVGGPAHRTTHGMLPRQTSSR